MVGFDADWRRFLKNEAYDPTNIDDDATADISKFSQPRGLRCMFNICKFLGPSSHLLFTDLKLIIHIDRATEANSAANIAAAKPNSHCQSLRLAVKGSSAKKWRTK